MRTATRLAIILVLLVATFGLAVHYGAAYDDNWPHPQAETVAEDPAAYEGERILFIGQVESVDPDVNEIVYRPDEDLEFTLRVTNFNEHVEPGGTVHVYGPIEEGGDTQLALSTVVVNENPGDSHYKLLMSGLGALLAAGLFLYYWRIDWRTLSFRRRGRNG